MNVARLRTNNFFRSINYPVFVFSVYKFLYKFNLNRISIVNTYASNPEIKHNFSNYEDEFETSQNYPIPTLNEISEGDECKVILLKKCQTELDLMFQRGKKVPSHLTPNAWYNLMSTKRKRNRENYLYQLWCIEEKEKILKIRKQKRNETYYKNKIKQKDEQIFSPHVYGLSKNTIFHRLRKPRLRFFFQYKMLQAYMFAPEIIIDMGFENDMRRIERNMCVSQINRMLIANRMTDSPYNIIFCNVSKCSKLMKGLKNLVFNLDEPDFPFIFTEKNYLDLYPKEKLVYLTPDCEKEIEYYDPNCVYIMGAFVDIERNVPLSLEKAQRDNLQMVRLPLQKYLSHEIPENTVNLRECLSIMTDIKEGKKWHDVLKKITERKTLPEKNRIMDLVLDYGYR